MPLLARSNPKKNMIPPFSSGKWTLHENTRMKQANFAGKVSGSIVENPHTASRTSSGTTGTTSLQVPGAIALFEVDAAYYSTLLAIDGNVAQPPAPITNSGGIAQFLFSFNLIEHVLRNYGASVFGSAVTVADRVAWLKANITKINFNWHGWGSGPAGNKATITFWLPPGGSGSQSNAWASSSLPSTTSGTVAKLTAGLSSSVPTSFLSYAPNAIDANGFMHFLAYADASDEVTASTIRTDFVELEVYMKEGSIPQPGYEMALSATSTFHQSKYTTPVLPNTTYCLRGISQSGRVYVAWLDATGTSISLAYLYGTTNLDVGNGTDVSKVITSPANAVSVQIVCDNSNIPTGTSTFRNLQLEQGSVATPFEPYIPIPDNKPALGSIKQAATVKQAVKVPKKNVFPLFNAPIFTLQNGAQASADGRTLTVNTNSPTQVIFASTLAVVQVEPGVQYRLSATCTGVARVRLGKNDNSFLQSVTALAPSRAFTATENTIRLTVDNNGLASETAGPGPGTVADLMICKASQDQKYEPYTLANKPAIR